MRPLGRTELEVSAISFSFRANSWWWSADEGRVSTAKECVRLARRGGVNFFDVGDGVAEIEEVMGSAMRELRKEEPTRFRRADLLLSTRMACHSASTVGTQQSSVSQCAKNNMKACLSRLGEDYLDLVFCEQDSTIPVETIVRSMTDLVHSGQVRFWATSEWPAKKVSEAMEVARKHNLEPPTAVQSEYSMFSRKYVEVDNAQLDKYGLGSTVVSTLASGLLTGKHIDRGSGAEDLETLCKAGLKLEALGLYAQTLGCTVPQLALAWCLRNSSVTTAVSAASDPKQIEENFEAVALVKRMVASDDHAIEKILDNLPEKPAGSPVKCRVPLSEVEYAREMAQEENKQLKALVKTAREKLEAETVRLEVEAEHARHKAKEENAKLRGEVENAQLRAMLEEAKKQEEERLRSAEQESTYYYASDDAVTHEPDDASIPLYGKASDHCYRRISDSHEMDFRVRLNTSSYVNVHLEEDEQKVANLGMGIDLNDKTAYPSSAELHDTTLNMIANLWHCPKTQDFEETGVFPGAGTVGSTEACLLGGLALKFRWRKWYARRHGLTDREVRGVQPNLVISTCFQAAWEKFLKYFDVEAKLVTPSSSTFALTAEDVKDVIDDRTIGVVCILGNHYAGQYDPVWEVDAMLQVLNEERGWQVGIHVDAASGGFIAPFQDNMAPWDFRLPTVLSISASGHKFGESVCGTGWLVWRQREGLAEYAASSPQATAYTLSSSRPASGVYVQYYKFQRLGLDGFRALCNNRMTNSKYLRDCLKAMTHNGKPIFRMLDDGDELCLPVVAACFNQDLNLPYSSVDLQHRVAQSHWYVSGYKMNFIDPNDESTKALFWDASSDQTMFRVVMKANVTRNMVENLVESISDALKHMDAIGEGYQALNSTNECSTRPAC